eukprot:364607-Chlamydomonas_euryale.AAC.2
MPTAHQWHAHGTWSQCMCVEMHEKKGGLIKCTALAAAGRDQRSRGCRELGLMGSILGGKQACPAGSRGPDQNVRDVLS